MTFVDDVDHEKLVDELTQYVTHSLGHWHGEEDYVEYQKRCPEVFKKLSPRTLDLLAEFGRLNGRDAVPEHLGVRSLINANANENHYLYYALLQPPLARNELGNEVWIDSEVMTAICVSMELYEPFINSLAKDAPKPIEERISYYRSLSGVVLALLDISGGKELLKEVQVLKEHEQSNRHTEIESYKELPVSPIIKDEALIELVIQNVGRSDGIWKFMRERNTVSVEMIAKYLNDSHTSVSSGIL